jgi:hypothetical protein
MTTATATEYPTTLANGRTGYTVEMCNASHFGRGPAFMVTGSRGARYILAPVIDFDATAPVWVLVSGKSSSPFEFATITNGKWDVIR